MDCPSAAPSASIAPTVPVSAAPSAIASAAVSAPAPEVQKLLWYDVWSAGAMFVRAHPSGVALVPMFLGAEIEGTTAAVLDPAGLAKWERKLGAVGAQDTAVAPDGSIVSIAVDPLDWPKTEEAYAMSRITTIAADGKSQRSFRLPAKAEAQSIDLDAGGNVIVTGRFSGLATFGKGISLTAKDDETRGFVAGYGAEGRAQWVRGFPDIVTAKPASPGKLLLLMGSFNGPGGQEIVLADTSGHDLWTLKRGPEGNVYSILTVGESLFAVATPGCLDPVPPEKPSGVDCALHRLDAATGKVLSSVALPGCAVWADARGATVVTDDRQLSLLDAAGKTLWTTHLVIPEVCANLGYETIGVALDASSIWVTGKCMGDRIGTMFNSPYSRAYDRSSTYLGRYDRR